MTNPPAKTKSFWGLRRRRHIRNETLTIVWNYTSFAVRSWWAKARGEEPPPEPSPPRRAIMEHPDDWLVPTPPRQQQQEQATSSTKTAVGMATAPATSNSNDVVLQID